MKKFIILGTMSLLLVATIVPNAFADMDNTTETDMMVDRNPVEVADNSDADNNNNKDTETTPKNNPPAPNYYWPNYNNEDQSDYWRNHFNYMGSMMGSMMGGYGMMGGYYGPNSEGNGYSGWGNMMGGYYGPNTDVNSYGGYGGWGGMMGGYPYPAQTQ
ncbi:MAG: hypothetical protein FH758_15780 [Firmicutes bacterium]|nr:hypothetical protein [Bacillota bacterium]